MTTADKAEEVPKKIMDVVKDFKAAAPARLRPAVAARRCCRARRPACRRSCSRCSPSARASCSARSSSSPGVGEVPRPPSAAAGAEGQRGTVHRLRRRFGDGVPDHGTADHHRPGARQRARADGRRGVARTTRRSRRRARGSGCATSGSSNGTTVNGQPAVDVLLGVGDEIGIGSTRTDLHGIGAGRAACASRILASAVPDS